MSPSELNAVARLVLIAKRCGPQFLDNADSFDNVIGSGRFAETDSQILDLVRRVVEASPDSESEDNIVLSELEENISQDSLER
jgi:hypothetical protein